jgi:Icc-related predicted phosphoesterase
MDPKAKVRVAAASDIHYTRSSGGAAASLLEEASQKADVLLLCGDLTDYGLEEEAQILARDIRAHARIPVVGVVGNHDYQSGHVDRVIAILEEAGVHMLDGESIEINGVGFAGVCGFGGGFGRRMLSAWGEDLIKQFVQEAIDHALKLERALARLSTSEKIAVLHYSPIRETVMGEDPEIFPFLGSTRLEEPLNRHRASAAVHGHAHKGAASGKTSSGIPVYNVSLHVLKREFPEGPPFRILELKRD